MDSSDFSAGILPNDVIALILARLPIKTLFRCKLVCKIWCRLFSEKHFIDLHFELSSKNPSLLLEITKPVQKSISYVVSDIICGGFGLSLGFLNDRVRVRASCNGLLCCTSFSNRGVYYVCNPMTREFRLLPGARERPFTSCQHEYEATLVGLAFDPKSWKFSVALAGLFRPYGHRPHNELICLVFNSETGAWRRFITSHYDEFTIMNRNQVVFANGFLHWLTYSYTYVLALDLQHEIWMKISLPDEILDGKFGIRIYLLELEGEVSVVQMSSVSMSIWVLKDHMNEKWVLMETVNLRCIRGLVANVFPVCQNSDVIFLADQKKILTYGRKNRVWREVYASKETGAYPLWFSAYAYRSSLFPCLLGADQGLNLRTI